jgi:hypothetical protein
MFWINCWFFKYLKTSLILIFFLLYNCFILLIFLSSLICSVQFNHLYADSKNVALYTNLCNIVMTPTFIAKLTDKHPSITELLKYRAFKLYGFDPENKLSTATPPKEYEGLEWAKPLPPVENAEKILRAKVENSKEYRLKTSVEKYGWYFSGFQPTIEL